MKRHDNETKEVVITPEDVRNVDEFFNTFKIEMPPILKEIMDKLRADFTSVTFDDQIRLRAALAYTMYTSQHALLQDEAFANIRENCSQAYLDMQFDADMEALLAKKASALPDLAQPQVDPVPQTEG